MLSDENGSGPGTFEPLGHRPVQCDPPSPWDLAVEGVAHQGMPKCHASGIGLDHHAAAQQLVGPLRQSGNCHDQLRIKHLAGHGGGADGIASVVGQASCPQQHSVTDAVRQRKILTLEQLQPGCARYQAAARCQCRTQLTYEEGNSIRPVEDFLAQ